MKGITLIFKPTYQCIVQCRHCSVAFKNSSKKVTEDEVVYYFKKFLKFLTLINLNVESIELIWHGGEPMLMGAKFYLNVFERLKRDIPEVNFRHGMQTNLLLYDSVQWRPVFENMMNWRVGTSYDFFTTVRPYHENFKEKWLENVHFMVQNGVFISVNITLTKLVNVELLFNFIDEMLKIGVKGFHLERFTSSGRGKFFSDGLYLNNEEFFNLMIDILDRYIKELQSGKFFYLNPFDKMTKSYFFGRGGGCFSGDCMARMITINPDGTVSNCPDLAFYDEYIFGNLLTDSFEQIFYNKKRLKAIKAQEMFICSDCEFFPYCHGGCPHHFAGFDGKSCRKFFSVFTDKVNLLYNYLIQ